MPVICPKDECQLHQGMCGHDVAMLTMGVLLLAGALGAVAHWGLGLL